MHLTPRQRQVLQRVGKGEKLEAIALDLGITHRAVRWHLDNIRKKAAVATTIQAIIFFCSHPVHKDSCLNSQLSVWK
jgi:DNA-binding NarL/FixJ family response regulator